MVGGRGVPYWVNPSLSELELIRSQDKYGDIRVGIDGDQICAWRASDMLHDSFEKSDRRKFKFRSTLMQHEQLDKLLAALQDLAARDDLRTTMKDDAILRKHAYRED